MTELLVLTLVAVTGLSSATQAQAYAGHTPGSVVAFYYPWYDPRNASSWWDSNKMSSLPTVQYQSGDVNTMRSQMESARASGIDAFAVSWNSPNGDWGDRFNKMLSLAGENWPGSDGLGFSLAVHYETTLVANNSVANTISNLQYIRDNYGHNPHYLHFEGKPVVFFWRPENVTSISNWQNIRNQVDPNHEMIWSTDSIDTSVLSVFDGIHLFSAAKWDNNPTAKYQEFRNEVTNYQNSHGQRKLWIAGVTPGYDDRKLRSPGEFRDRENGNYYKRSWDAAISSSPDMITISTWNEWYEGTAIESGQLWGNLYTDITAQNTLKYKGTTLASFGESSVMKVWSHTDLPVKQGSTPRTWMWGPLLFDDKYEKYNEGPGGSRLVYYFDKSRMEITRPSADPNAQWFVTNGLLVREMMLGKISVGDNPNSTQDKGAANIPVAGNFDKNPNSPTFASMSAMASLANNNRSTDRTGQTIEELMAGNGRVTKNQSLDKYNIKYAHFDNTLGHTIAQPFWDFFQQSGPVVENVSITNGPVVDWLFAMGYPITDAYWCRVTVGSMEKDVLVQAFERRIMTYTPSNPPGFQVEMGNVGRQYHLWRYGN